MQLEPKQACPCCDKGVADLVRNYNQINATDYIACYGYVCDTCGSEYADAKCVDVNCEIMREYRSQK